MPTVKFVNEKKTIEVPAGSNLRKEARKAGVQLYSGPHKYLNCMGKGLCGSCRVHVKKGVENINKQGILEKLRLLLGPITFFARLGHEEDLRLSCKTKIQGDCEIETHPPMNLHGDKYWG